MQTRAISDLPEYRHIIEHLVCTRLSSRFVAFRPAIINETGNLERKKYHNKRYSYHILRNAKPAPALLSLSRHPGLPRHAALLLAHGRGSNSPPCLVICISSGAADSPSGSCRRITPSPPPWRTPLALPSLLAVLDRCFHGGKPAIAWDLSLSPPSARYPSW